MRVLDLCSGLEGWSATWRRAGHEVTTIDNDARFGADIVGDVRGFRPARGAYDVILASPPCTLFSTAGWHRHAWRMTGDKRKGTNRYEPVKPEAELAAELVRAVVRIVDTVQPWAAIVENPRALLRQLGLVPYPRRTVWYCHYRHDGDGLPVAKPTDLWVHGAAEALAFQPPCHNRRPEHPRSCCCRDHRPAPRGSVTGTQGRDTAEAARIPPGLALHVRRQLESLADRG